MLDYSPLAALVRRADPGADPGADPFAAAIEFLVETWLDDYNRLTPSLDIVETTYGDFSYLFDIKYQRLIAAWGVSRGPHGEPRDKSRMAGHPLSAGRRYHRGHAIPHSLGGLTDINLVPQLGRVNVGAFRRLEKLAVATRGALYFTYWAYGRSDTQTPRSVDQGLLRVGEAPMIERHAN